MPLISVIVPVYQMQDYLECCIDSLLKQTWIHFELLLVDDGSTDNSGSICDRYAAYDPRVRVVRKTNGGLSSARNIGLLKATGELISFVDADDWVDETYLEKLYATLCAGKAGMASCNHWIVPEHSAMQARFPVNLSQREYSLHEAYDSILYHGIPDVSAWGKLYRRDVFSGITYPTGHVFEDTYCIADLLKNADGVSYCPDALYYYRFRTNSISKSPSEERIRDFGTAVDCMTDRILSVYPEMHRGCKRRKMHALLSMRRFYVGCVPQRVKARNELEKQIRKEAWPVLTDRRAPLRDKIAIMATLAGHSIYDRFWTQYNSMRW